MLTALTTCTRREGGGGGGEKEGMGVKWVGHYCQLILYLVFMQIFRPYKYYFRFLSLMAGDTPASGIVKSSAVTTASNQSFSS